MHGSEPPSDPWTIGAPATSVALRRHATPPTFHCSVVTCNGKSCQHATDSCAATHPPADAPAHPTAPAACPGGQYQDKVGGPACKACLAGLLQDEEARPNCTVCPAGYYANGIRRTACTACADPASTCVCKGGGWVSVASLSVCEGVGPHRPAHAPSCIQSIQGHTLESPDRVCVSWVRGGGQSLEGGHHHTMDQ